MTLTAVKPRRERSRVSVDELDYLRACQEHLHTVEDQLIIATDWLRKIKDFGRPRESAMARKALEQVNWRGSR